ncbi:uncharacterized protein LOC118276239 isoform X1 [Spodoptera frugiperda]|uniref:Uncharacterized protein LOC118276239 isoform X1 n=1 Tax=Spodoptera frugiperda TaxID=7108 RepID=A0A9R0ECF8_SPOFR|nr:uncharacterized protein LOC118276239 isoform X1 [Spodoptera frugiperda]XP_050563378.1 uncharacterized protein LOC118276239 isoform X1 [Spodoptera frugiperda]
MRRVPLAALLRLIIIAGGANFVNPYVSEERVDLNQVWVEIPSTLVALGGDVHIRVHGTTGAGLKVRIAREDDDGRALLATMPLALDSENRMTLPCGYFSRGGTYYLEVISDKDPYLPDYDNTTEGKREVEISNKVKRDVSDGSLMETGDSVVKSWKFDVMWPTANLDVTPEQIQTYPERQVMAILEFPRVVCTPIESSADFWLELLYCGHSSGGAVLCDGKNTSSHAHVLYSEQMHGFPGRRTMTLRCELFGQAGDYALTLRPAAAAGPQDLATAFIKADWSEQFVLNVHGGSVFPCGDGVRVLFQYPECVLEGADRVRVFGRDADRLRYVAERRVRRGQHTVSFDCRLFSERYPEYCFVYVSQAVTGAVADVRMDCLPTLPLSADGGAGGWGQWSAWSACPAPAHCSTRTRSRHRFCDSPPPAYGAKFCEGQAVELAACECAAQPWAGDSSMVVAEVGARCRCGCVLHLAPTARLLAGSARACPARSFWLLRAEEGLVVRLRMEAVRLPCAGQSLRARDGDSLGSPLLASWDGPDSTAVTSGDVETTTDGSGVMEIAGGRHILVELRSGDTSDRCAGGFLAHATQIEPIRNASAAWASVSGGMWWRGGSGAREAAVALAAAAALAALCLALHSAHRTRAYQRAADKESLTDSDACSASLELGGAPTGSRSTLLSEVVGGGVSLRRLLPSGKTRHTRLRDSDRHSENVEQRDEEDPGTDIEAEPDNTSVVSAESVASQATVTPETVSSSSAPVTGNIPPSPLRRSHTVSVTNVSQTHAPQVTSPPQSTTDSLVVEMSTSVSSVSERDSCSEKDRDSCMWDKDRSESRASSSTSAATLTNGWYSPALSGVSAAKIRDNPKHTKESCNRRLLRSDLSLTSHPEMEIDYYDYEVNNAGSVPGSYLGMDPAFLVWIPPLEEGDILKEIDENKVPIYEEILPKDLHPDPGSNTESPEDRPSSSTLKRNPDNRINRSNESIKSFRKVIEKGNIIHPLNFSISDLQNSPKMAKRNKKKKAESPVTIQMKDLTLTRSPVRVHRKENRSDYDTSTLKRVNEAKEKDSATLKRNDFSDIKFADENSDSSSEIKFADDSPDSNRIVDKYNVKT